ncbi:MAG TPA: glycosyltransferase family 2 protein [Planctomycetota bacterium]|nr:glycosyltransferase family 2 protein [Planctomycetota bacterium]
MSAPRPKPPRISVLVCTRNRGGKIGPCVRSILASPLAEMELLVVDQSTNDETRRALEAIRDPRLRYLPTGTRGLARARNIGIRACASGVVLFTDDDCVVERDWVEAILREFEADPEVGAVYGRVLPLGKGGPGEHCPTVMESTERRVVQDLEESTHEAIGHGNNMAFRRELFARFGLYLEWLGAGTPMRGGEDSEFTFRILSRGVKVLYTPSALAHHDNWMPLEASKRQLYRYMLSASAVFTRFALRGSAVALRVQAWRYRTYWRDFIGSVRWKNWPAVVHVGKLLFVHTLGHLLGLLFVARRPPRYALDAVGTPRALELAAAGTSP